MSRRVSLLSIFLLFLNLLVVRGVHAADLAMQLLDASSVATTIRQYPALFKEGVREGLADAAGPGGFPVETLDRIVDRSFDTETMLADVASGLRDTVSEDDLRTMLEWLNSPAGKRVAEVEKASVTSDAYREMATIAMDLQRQYRGSPREKLFQEFDRVAQATESTLDGVISVQVALATAMAKAAGRATPDLASQLRAQIEENRFMLRGLVGQQVYASYLYTYRELSDAELQAYVAQLGSPAGQRVGRATTETLKQAMLVPVEKIGEGLARQMRQP